MNTVTRKDKFKCRLENFPKGRLRCFLDIFFFPSPSRKNAEVQECTDLFVSGVIISRGRYCSWLWQALAVFGAVYYCQTAATSLAVKPVFKRKLLYLHE